MYRLILPPTRWRDDLPRLAHAERQGWCYLRRAAHADGVHLIAPHAMTGLVATSRGCDFGPLDNLLLVRLTETTSAAAADELLNRFQPGPDQLVVSLVLGIGPAAGRWLAVIEDRGRRVPLDEFVLVGPGMRRMSLAPAPSLADPHDRWSRTRGALGEQVWQRARASCVAVVGASRNGSVAAYGFAMLGVAQLILVDPEREHWDNLDAILGGSPEGVGDYKVLNRRAALLGMRPDDLEVHALAAGLPNPHVERRLQTADLICTCVDRDAARLICARLANQWGKVHLDVGTGVLHDGGERHMGGDVRLLLPGEACVSCLGGLRDLARAREEADAPPDALHRGRRQAWHEGRAGSLLTVNSVAVHLGLQLWLSLLAGQITHSQWLHLAWNADGLPTIEPRANPSPECAICGRSPR